MLCVLPNGQVVKADMKVDGRVEVRCPACDGIIYHDAIFTDDVQNQMTGHKAECQMRHAHPEPADD
jgi:hypothetical protein